MEVVLAIEQTVAGTHAEVASRGAPQPAASASASGLRVCAGLCCGGPAPGPWPCQRPAGPGPAGSRPTFGASGPGQVPVAAQAQWWPAASSFAATGLPPPRRGAALACRTRAGDPLARRPARAGSASQRERQARKQARSSRLSRACQCHQHPGPGPFEAMLLPRSLGCHGARDSDSTFFLAKAIRTFRFLRVLLNSRKSISARSFLFPAAVASGCRVLRTRATAHRQGRSRSTALTEQEAACTSPSPAELDKSAVPRVAP
jgi:hypothetical protein